SHLAFRFPVTGAGNSVVIDPQNSSVLYTIVMTIPDSGDLYKSTNGGQQWSQIFTGGLDEQATNAVDMMISNDASALYIGNGRGVLKSMDGGRTWSYVN